MGETLTNPVYHRRAMTRPALAALLCACLFAFAACGGGSDKSKATATPTATDDTAASTDCQKVDEPKPRDEGNLAKPKEKLSGSKTYVAKVSTNCGDFEITLDSKRAPRTGGAFKTLADKHFFDNLTFHRIVSGFVIQGGDPKGDGTGGPGFTVVEPPPRKLAYTKGVVAMAKSQADPPGASGSQFFVVTGEDAQLPPDYALLGKVTSGQDVVDKIGLLPTTSDEQPVDPVVIKSITVTEK
jgi:peptidyl-prolyl cis-trans isomerase B (cyclophilin B)